MPDPDALVAAFNGPIPLDWEHATEISATSGVNASAR